MPTARELLRFLPQNGYLEVRPTGSHVILVHPERCSLVIPIHRGKDISKRLFLRILKDAGFTLEEFHEG